MTNTSQRKSLSNTKQINSLTGARFIAIMIIVFSHFEYLHNHGQFGNFYWRFLHNATMGVDFFFMLSGFGMMLSYLNKTNSSISKINLKTMFIFAKKHISKIYLTYVIFLILAIPYYCIYAHYNLNYSMIQIIKRTILFFSVDITLLQSCFGLSSISHSLNGVCWFLSSLFCIYIVSPVIMKYLKKIFNTINKCLIGLLLSFFISFMLSILFNNIEKITVLNDLCYSSPYRRVFYVIPGMIIAIIYNIINKDSIRLPKVITNGSLEYITITIAIVWFFLRNSISYTISNYIYLIDMSIVAAVLFTLSISKGKISDLLSKKHMIYLGKISMYIFISHYIIRLYIDYIFKYFNLVSLKMAVFETIINIVLTIGISIIIKKYNK